MKYNPACNPDRFKMTGTSLQDIPVILSDAGALHSTGAPGRLFYKLLAKLADFCVSIGTFRAKIELDLRLGT